MPDFKFIPALPAGALVVITGANGYIAAHVCDQFLGAAYNVRGTVRSPERAKWMLDLFGSRYGPGKFSLIAVEDVSADGAFDEAARGAAAFIHIASDVDVPVEPEPYVSRVTASALSTLKSAAKEPSMKRFVLTSSSMACAPWGPGVEYTLQPDEYNEAWMKKAYEGPFDGMNGWRVYAAAKVASEKAAWKWVAENKPSFVFNTAMPAGNFGKAITGDWKSTGQWAKMAVDGDLSIVKHVSSQYFVDVVDMAKLYLGTTIHPDVKNERILGASEPYDWNQVLRIVREAYPDMKVGPDIDESVLDYKGREMGKYLGRERSEWLLKELGQSKGWTTLKETLVEAFRDPSGKMAGGLGSKS